MGWVCWWSARQGSSGGCGRNHEQGSSSGDWYSWSVGLLVRQAVVQADRREDRRTGGLAGRWAVTGIFLKLCLIVCIGCILLSIFADSVPPQ